jgi:exosome complex RNA-binding protein Rrp4
MENSDKKIVIPGDYIGPDFVSGHGTYLINNEIYASLAGVVH